MSEAHRRAVEMPHLWGRRRGDVSLVGESVAANRAAPVTARDVDAGAYLQTFLVTAIAAILVTRLYLELAGFPQVGGRGLHIAHLLWGGLLMLVAQALLLAALGKRLKRIAAVVGGAGFGLFLDELGKFVTSDNDYFFQPAIALIYVIFVALFFAFRAYERHTLTPEELLINAADMIKELILGGATTAEVARSLALLDRSGAQGPLAEGLYAAVAGVACDPDRPPSRWERTTLAAWRLYDRLVNWRWFQRAVLLVFVGQALIGVGAAVALGAAALQGWDVPLDRLGFLPLQASLGVGGLATSVASLVLVLIGVLELRRSRLGAYRWFERSVLIAILFTQVIQFWQDQLAALGGLAWNLVLLNALRYTIRQEESRQAVAVLQESRSEPIFGASGAAPATLASRS